MPVIPPSSGGRLALLDDLNRMIQHQAKSRREYQRAQTQPVMAAAAAAAAAAVARSDGS